MLSQSLLLLPILTLLSTITITNITITITITPLCSAIPGVCVVRSLAFMTVITSLPANGSHGASILGGGGIFGGGGGAASTLVFGAPG